MLGSYHQATEYFEIIFNKDKFNSAAGRASGDPRICRRGRLDRQSGDRPRQLLDATCVKLQQRARRQRLAHRAVDPRRPAQGLGRAAARPDARTRSSPRSSRARRPGSSGWCSTSCTTPPTSGWPTSTSSGSSTSERGRSASDAAGLGGADAPPSLSVDRTRLERSRAMRAASCGSSTSCSLWVGHAFAWCILILTLGHQLRGLRPLRAAARRPPGRSTSAT